MEEVELKEMEGAVEEEEKVVAGVEEAVTGVVEEKEDPLQVHVGHLLLPLELHLHLVELISRISETWEQQPGATLEQAKVKVV